MGSPDSLSLDIETKAVSPNRPILFIPFATTMRAERAINKLMSGTEDRIKLLMAQIVDYHGLMDIITAIKALRVGEDESRKKKVKLILDLAEKQLKLAKNRRSVLFEFGGLPLRINGEKLQRTEEQRDFDHSDRNPREQERMSMQAKLWDDCGVFVDIDTIPAKLGNDSAEQTLTSVAKARTAQGISHEVLRPGSFEDFGDKLRKLSKDVADLKAFGTHPQSEDHAIGFIRELHLFGHGVAGGADSGLIPSFWPFGINHPTDVLDWTFMTAKLKKSPNTFAAADSLGLLRDLLVPGATVVFRGCEVGKGQLGKEFLALVALWVFGDDKWGYVRANQKNVFAVPGSEALGPPYRDPVTYKWPDDLKKTANKRFTEEAKKGVLI